MPRRVIYAVELREPAAPCTREAVLAKGRDSGPLTTKARPSSSGGLAVNQTGLRFVQKISGSAGQRSYNPALCRSENSGTRLRFVSVDIDWCCELMSVRDTNTDTGFSFRAWTPERRSRRLTHSPVYSRSARCGWGTAAGDVQRTLILAGRKEVIASSGGGCLGRPGQG